MALIRTKLKQLRDADVRYISLVDRAATRIPFRVLKRDKETTMGIDLMGVFKSDETAKPYVSAVVVFAQKSEAAATQVLEAIKKHGFLTDRVQKSDEGETLVYAQCDQPKDAVVVRLSDQSLVSVANLSIPNGWVGDLIEKNGFVPDLKMAHAALLDGLVKATKSETPQEDAGALLSGYAEYLSRVLVLPAAVFALDEAVTDIVQKCSCEEKEEKEEVVKESPEEQKKRIAGHPPSEMAPCDEEDDQKPPPDAVEKNEKKKDEAKKSEAKKSDDTAILTALKGIEERMTAQVAALSKKVDTVTTEQAEQKKVLDGVVQKADTLNETLKTTVPAAPKSEDRPAYDQNRMRVQKDDDPRTGNFDTAFLRRNNRR
jgi:hypothetical protein